MSDYAEGDFVEAVRGRTRISGVLVTYYASLMIKDAGWSIGELMADGFTVTTIERAKPALPTEPGWYLAGEGTAVYLASDGYRTTPESFGVTGVDMNRYVPLTRLEPVPETAKKVLDAVAARTVMHCSGCTDHLLAIAAEFGVTGDAS